VTDRPEAVNGAMVREQDPESRSGDAEGQGEPKGGATARDDDELRIPSLREEIRTAAQYGLAGRWAAKRRTKILTEIERNRRGEYKVPTWVLAVILVAVVTGWVLVVVLS
jgi:hypothetical protein